MKLDNLAEVNTLSASLQSLLQQRQAWRAVSQAEMISIAHARDGEHGAPGKVMLTGEDALHLIDVQIRRVSERLHGLGVEVEASPVAEERAAA